MFFADLSSVLNTKSNVRSIRHPYDFAATRHDFRVRASQVSDKVMHLMPLTVNAFCERNAILKTSSAFHCCLSNLS